MVTGAKAKIQSPATSVPPSPARIRPSTARGIGGVRGGTGQVKSRTVEQIGNATTHASYLLDLIQHDFGVEVDDQQPSDRAIRVALDIQVERRDIDLACAQAQNLMDVIAVRLVLKITFGHDVDLTIAPVHTYDLMATGIQVADLIDMRIGLGERGEVPFDPLARWPDRALPCRCRHQVGATAVIRKAR